MQGPLFYYRNFPDLEFTTALLSFAYNRYINKCKYPIFMNLKYISQWKIFLTNFAKNWKGRHFTVNEHRNFKLSDQITFLWRLSKIGILLLKLVLEIGILGLFPSAFNQDDLSKNQKNKIASSAARNSKKSGLLKLKFSDLKNPCLYFLLIKI